MKQVVFLHVSLTSIKHNVVEERRAYLLGTLPLCRPDCHQIHSLSCFEMLH